MLIIKSCRVHNVSMSVGLEKRPKSYVGSLIGFDDEVSGIFHWHKNNDCLSRSRARIDTGLSTGRGLKSEFRPLVFVHRV